MAKIVVAAGILTHTIVEPNAETNNPGMISVFDIRNLFPTYDQMTDAAKAAVDFALKTASRNATAGKLDTAENMKKAFDAVVARHKAWAGQVWKAASESSGEPRESLLAKAIAEALDWSVDDAVAFVGEQITTAYDAANLDTTSDEDEDIKKRRKVANEVRKQLSEDSGIKPILARMRAEEAQKRAEEAAKASSASDAKPSILASLAKR